MARGRLKIDDEDRKVGARIKQARIMRGLTQQQVAEAVGVTYQQAYKYEAGINRVACGVLVRIARCLDQDPGWFFQEAISISARPSDMAELRDAAVRLDQFSLRRLIDYAKGELALNEMRKMVA